MNKTMAWNRETTASAHFDRQRSERSPALRGGTAQSPDPRITSPEHATTHRAALAADGLAATLPPRHCVRCCHLANATARIPEREAGLRAPCSRHHWDGNRQPRSELLLFHRGSDASLNGGFAPAVEVFRAAQSNPPSKSWIHPTANSWLITVYIGIKNGEPKAPSVLQC
jgi:hypothetical protein